MKKTALLLIFILAACAYEQAPDRQRIKPSYKPVESNMGGDSFIDSLLKPKVEYGNMEQMIEMQNPATRDVVFCIKDYSRSAEDCAEMFEKRGFVRLKEIPYKTANYDLLRTDTYPTRRWRDGEITPRW